MATISIALILLVCVGLAIRKLRKDKRNGSTCSCGCSDCSSSCSTHK